MLPAAPGRAGGGRERPPSGPAPPENTKDIIMIYEEDAEEWALYLREVFSHVVKREAILLHHLEDYPLQDLELLNLNSYKCKLLILSSSLLEDLTPKKCQFLENVLHSPESVVVLLCGVTNSDQFYKSLNIAESKWELSTEQGPEDYISVIESILSAGSEDYLEFNIATDVKVEHSGGVSEKNQVEELPEVSRSSTPLAVVLPTEVPCENPGEIFIILRDEVISDAVEVEFISYNKCIRIRPALWNKTVWCMKALDFPAGSVSVNVYCDGIMKAAAEIKYYTTEKAGGCLSGLAGSGDGVCWNDMQELDDILTSVFKQEIPYYEFRSLQTEIYPQKEYRNFKELPTLLHCAAKFGLKNLAIHLLQCSGATSACQMKNLEGSDPAHIAERHGHKELQKIFEDFSLTFLIPLQHLTLDMTPTPSAKQRGTFACPGFSYPEQYGKEHLGLALLHSTIGSTRSQGNTLPFCCHSRTLPSLHTPVWTQKDGLKLQAGVERPSGLCCPGGVHLSLHDQQS